MPQLVWLSEHKALVFGVAGGLLAVSGISLWVGRTLPCPTDAGLARSCRRLRRASLVLYAIALPSFGAGAIVAFVLPALLGAVANGSP